MSALLDAADALRSSHSQEQLIQQYRELIIKLRGIDFYSQAYDDMLDQMDVVWYAMDENSHQLIEQRFREGQPIK